MSDDPGRYAVLRFELHVEYVPTAGEARQRLAALRPLERVAVVDRETGTTHSKGETMERVLVELESQGTAPRVLRRAGSVASFLQQGPRGVRRWTTKRNRSSA